MPETDPLGKAPGERGSKLDAGKIAVYQGLFAYFPAACAAVANVSTIGAKKYSWKGWEDVPDGINRYSDALCRHILQESLEGPWDSGEGGTGELHAAQVAWNAMARLELIARCIKSELDAADRGVEGLATDLRHGQEANSLYNYGLPNRGLFPQ